MKVAVVTAAMRSSERGGAEALYAGLVAAVRAAGHDVTPLEIPIDESNFEAVLASYTRCYDVDTSSFDVVISTKAPTYMVRHPRHVSYLVHTLRVFYDRFDAEYPDAGETRREQRRLIRRLDKAGLNPARVCGHFAIGRTPFERLYEADSWWRQVPFTVLHPPPAFDRFRRPRRGEYVFLPGRLHRWKRVDLVVRAFRRLKHQFPLLIAGTGEDEARVRLAGEGDSRIQFLGAVSNEQLLDLYAGALVVPFVPVQEDYGLITIEAFRSHKPVITCTDSGETLQFVKDGENGFVVEPDEKALADRLAFLIDRPEAAARMGNRGARSVAHIKWKRIVSSLLSAATAQRAATVPVGSVVEHPHRDAPASDRHSATKVTVLDMQPIDPAVGGGRLRLLGLYHNLGADAPTTYVGTYDWPGPCYRDHQLTPTLREIDVPLSDRHFAAAGEWHRLSGGKTVIDASFGMLAHHSPAFADAARVAAFSADVVVFSHPWVFLLVRDVLRWQEQFIVYDAHNVESVLRYRLLGDTEAGLRIVRHVTAVERELCRRADLVLACSHEDRDLFHRLYEMPFAKCLVTPNGTFVGEAPSKSARRERKRRLGVGGNPLAIFIGSRFPPNEEAAHFICSELAPAVPDVTFAICGGVGGAIDGDSLARRGICNVRITGTLDDAARREYLGAADVGINPMFSGSGTNIKMFDFMAAGLPVISTPTGARGINLSGSAVHICAAGEFAGAIRRVLADTKYAQRLGKTARRLACESYSWERLSPRLGRLLTRHRATHHIRPAFSVVVPTYERHAHLPKLLEYLGAQTFRDFEVILVDQSASQWTVPDTFSSLDILYEHTDLKGTSRARNLGAWLARGDVIAFTDDDCQPEPEWLRNAARYFDDPRVVGVEGLVVSEHLNDPEYRAVTNFGFEGIGFMTANLLLRREVFNAIDGFDEQFDVPFREDTDLGWRASELGDIPFAHDVRVFHPAHRRTVEREALSDRVRFFEKDALLFKKHPERYRTLFLKEAHYLNTRGFHEHFRRGALKYGVNIDELLARVSAAGSV